MLSCRPLFPQPMLAQRITHLQFFTTTTLPPQISTRQFVTRCRPINAYTSPPPGSTSSSARSSISSTPRTQSNEKTTTQQQQQQQQQKRHASSSSKWVSRQSSDQFSREAKLQNLKSRAAFKLLQINERHHLFRPGMTVVDLGYAPGSWSQVAIDMVRPGLGRVIGVDVIPIQPPKGVNGIQGDFLSADVQARVRDFVRDDDRGRLRRSPLDVESGIVNEEAGYLDRERAATTPPTTPPTTTTESETGSLEPEDKEHEGKCVDVVLSDMSAPWEMNINSYKNSVSNPYRRMMNTTGNKFRDHAGSMDLCRSALYFSYETLKIGGHFVCKFYQGAEDKRLEKQLKAMFHKVHREKPESSRSESRESFFVAMKRLAKVDKTKVFDEG